MAGAHPLRVGSPRDAELTGQEPDATPGRSAGLAKHHLPLVSLSHRRGLVRHSYVSERDQGM